MRQKIQTSRDGPPAQGDLELSNVSDYGGGRHWRVPRASDDIVGGAVAGVAFAGVPDDFDQRFFLRAICIKVDIYWWKSRNF